MLQEARRPRDSWFVDSECEVPRAVARASARSNAHRFRTAPHHVVVSLGRSCPDYARATDAHESFISPHTECGSSERTEMTKSAEKMKRFPEKSKHKENDFSARERLPLFQTVICKLTLHTTLQRLLHVSFCFCLKNMDIHTEPTFCLFSELSMNQLNTSHCARSSAHLASNQITTYVQALKFQTQNHPTLC